MVTSYVEKEGAWKTDIKYDKYQAGRVAHRENKVNRFREAVSSENDHTIVGQQCHLQSIASNLDPPNIYSHHTYE